MDTPPIPQECSMFSTSSIYCWPLLQWFQTWGTCTPIQGVYRKWRGKIIND